MSFRLGGIFENIPHVNIDVNVLLWQPDVNGFIIPFACDKWAKL